MEPQFQQLAEQIARDVSDAITRCVTDAVDQHVTEVVTAAEERLSRQARVNVEAVKEEARIAADSYGGTVQSINDSLGRIESDLRMEQKSV